MIELSVCIPAYNRKEFMEPLLDSIIAQDYAGLEIVICEDKSPQREKIREIIESYTLKHKLNNKIRFYSNEENLGYDKNFRELLHKATGDFCLFMGNDDILAEGAIKRILNVIQKHSDVAIISRTYQWFLNKPTNIQDTVRHLPEDKIFSPGTDTIRFFFRRMGVLSGLVFNRKEAIAIETDHFDGHLYYQMYLAGMLLKKHKGYYISSVQTLSRDGIEPDFGNAEIEKEKFKPGSYLYDGRVHMVEGLLKIADYIDNSNDKTTYKAVKEDIAIYFYPYIRDQLSLPLKEYLNMTKKFMKLGMNNEPYFYIHIIFGYILKRNGYDKTIKFIRRLIGHSPRIGI